MDQMKVGRFLAQLRHEIGWTQEQLGERVGVTNKTVSRWENGNYMPDIDILQLLSDEYGVTIGELIAGERLNDAALRGRSNALVVDAAKKEAFSVKEKTAFWKRKWCRDHRAFIILLILLAAVGYFAVFFLLDFLGSWKPFVGVCWVLLCIVVYGMVRTRMMMDVENKVYGSIDPRRG